MVLGERLIGHATRINNGYDTITWEKMISIKQRILRIWDHASPTVRICCIKFVQRVVLAQSVASGAEPRVSCDLKTDGYTS